MLPKDLLTALEKGDRTEKWLEPKKETLDEMYGETIGGIIRNSLDNHAMNRMLEWQRQQAAQQAERNLGMLDSLNYMMRPGMIYKQAGDTIHIPRLREGGIVKKLTGLLGGD